MFKLTIRSQQELLSCCLFYVSSNISMLRLLLCYTFVSLFINLRHPRDFTSDASRRETLLLRVCVNVFFWHIGIFFSSGRGSFLVLSAPWRAGSPPEHQGASVGPGLRPWHVLWGLKVASPHWEAFRARRAIRAPANPRTGTG